MPMLQVNGVELFYELSGPTDAPIVAFSNSLGTTSAMWDGIVPALRGQYRSCVTTPAATVGPGS
jgi:3-oxoadipate enol-lactonase/4-carboxymuconolactone decarboxylase